MFRIVDDSNSNWRLFHRTSSAADRMENRDLDLAEYDQVDEYKQVIENQNQNKFVETLSSGSDHQASIEEINCENDYVFLPPAPQTEKKAQEATSSELVSNGKNRRGKASDNQNDEPQDESSADQFSSASGQPTGAQTLCRPLNESSVTNSNNPFGSKQIDPRILAQITCISSLDSIKRPFQYQQPQQQHAHSQQVQSQSLSQIQLLQKSQQIRTAAIQQQSPQSHQPFSLPTFDDYFGKCPSKPLGVIKPSLSASPNQEASQVHDLMQQIVSKSDSILISINCTYCSAPIVCPPSDISGFINHMNSSHNCKICPICEKFVGLGLGKDISVMQRHVVEHFDHEWLEKKSKRINFTYGLQQQWFPGSRCKVKDPRHR